MSRRFAIRLFSNQRRRVATIEFDHDFRSGWSMSDAAHGPLDEHPVTQFRRLSAESLARIESALIAVHGDPQAQP